MSNTTNVAEVIIDDLKAKCKKLEEDKRILLNDHVMQEALLRGRIQELEAEETARCIKAEREKPNLGNPAPVKGRGPIFGRAARRENP